MSARAGWACLGAGALGSSLTAWAGPGAAPHVGALARAFGVPLRLPHGSGVALTFDDGPHPEGTPAVLEALAAVGARATFFLVGEQVDRWPSLAARIAAAGHEVALHGHRHTLLLRRTRSGLAADLDRAVASIADATGRVPRCYRPPYGVFTATGVQLARERGWLPILWSRWGRDWGPRESPDAIAHRATAGLAPGDVVLLHDADHYSTAGSWRRTAAALPSILSAGAALGVPFVAVSQST